MGYVSIYTLGHETFVYMPNMSTPYAQHFLNDGSLVVEDSLYIDVRRPDGTLWRFVKHTHLPPGWNQYEPTRVATVEAIIRPDGSALDYHTTPHHELTAVTSTYGYRMDFLPTSDTRILNLSTTYCALGATQCAELEVGSRTSGVNIVLAPPPYGVVSEARTVNVTSGEGVQVDLTQTLVGATSPLYTGSESSAYCGGMHAMRTQTLTNPDGGVWTYSYQFLWNGGGAPSGRPHCHVVGSTSVGPNGATMTITGDPGHLRITDELGRVTEHTTEAWYGTAYENYHQTETGRVLSTVYPEGNRVDYQYVRGNVSRVTATPKPGQGSPLITFQAEYASTCTVTTMATCNRPLYTIDARGGRTDYTYHAPGGVGTGLLETVTGPAGPNGIRPQTRYSYQQLQARYQNASGQLVSSGRPIWKLVATSQCRTLASCAGTADETV
ncbi:MAG: hypothetical protein Q8R97_10825, partial [Brevundimonas sp.]|nr:hypothetical protein [Brevundimonas sp.]